MNSSTQSHEEHRHWSDRSDGTEIPNCIYGKRQFKIHVGILGCGGRGHYIARMMTQHGENDLHITALQDPFADRINHIKDAFDVSDDKCFVGIDTYKDLVDSGVDAVAITSPPYFHPAQVEYAVAQGKHIWLAKPVAVDVPGCEHIGKFQKGTGEADLSGRFSNP